MKVVLQHAARETKSADKIIDDLTYRLQDLKESLSDDEYAYLTQISPNGTIVMRGVDPAEDSSNKTKWKKVNIGDIALVLWDKYAREVGEVVLCKESGELARLMDRGPEHSNNSKYCLTYFLRKPRKIEIPYSALNEVLGYKPGNYFQAFQVLDAKKSLAVLELLRSKGALDANHKPIFEEFLLDGKLDQKTEVTRRLEQALLRSEHFGNKEYGFCALCEKKLPIELLVVAHIKKRSLCSDEEKRDWFANTIPACRFGCDELFERGYIWVENGFVKKSELNLPTTKEVDSYLKTLVDDRNKIDGWGKRAKYFDAHREFHQTKN